MKSITLLLTSEKDKMRQELDIEINALRKSFMDSCKQFEKFMKTFDKKYAALQNILAGRNMLLQGLAMMERLMENDVVTIDDNAMTKNIHDEIEIIIPCKSETTQNEEIEVNAREVIAENSKPNNSASLQVHEPTSGINDDDVKIM
ncbi:uncharacterized protein [Venturia canescens]|uniref:uncharacterized protein n=1 Tax=Venturia canescens TaxID=32260 RepID=UPI001C9C29B8|nr:uncharacterized protein LOC122406038 [Venturia canescens]